MMQSCQIFCRHAVSVWTVALHSHSQWYIFWWNNLISYCVYADKHTSTLNLCYARTYLYSYSHLRTNILDADAMCYCLHIDIVRNTLRFPLRVSHCSFNVIIVVFTFIVSANFTISHTTYYRWVECLPACLRRCTWARVDVFPSVLFIHSVAIQPFVYIPNGTIKCFIFNIQDRYAGYAMYFITHSYAPQVNASHIIRVLAATLCVSLSFIPLFFVLPICKVWTGIWNARTNRNVRARVWLKLWKTQGDTNKTKNNSIAWCTTTRFLKWYGRRMWQTKNGNRNWS